MFKFKKRLKWFLLATIDCLIFYTILTFIITVLSP